MWHRAYVLETLNKIKNRSKIFNYRLPGKRNSDTVNAQANYGDLYIVSKYCKIKKSEINFKGEWQHGWIHKSFNHPEEIVGTTGDSLARRKTWKQLVARQDQAKHLIDSGYDSVHTIGLPFVYTQDVDIKRQNNSLLVMPGHTIPGYDSDYQNKIIYQYLSLINEIKYNFEDVLVCLYENDYTNDNIEACIKAKLKYIKGAGPKDKSSLIRLKKLFLEYEFVTTNSIGSHVVYATAMGAKTSIYGTPEKIDTKSWAREYVYSKNPELFPKGIDFQLHWNMHEDLRKFDCEPNNAITNIAWGLSEIGFENKIKPKEMQQLFT